ncbi:hypothetical protein GDO81_005468 [Engystomops pustulosus]|uniref:Uncharacterized protein n=1 Tax=Engystomops pustulosus TaxID=76066 RepID=A0AAV7CQB6_ENGPU|nr:hypothetical protein GDO81_005468 [Engystomops pustulosus]
MHVLTLCVFCSRRVAKFPETNSGTARRRWSSKATDSQPQANTRKKAGSPECAPVLRP